MFYIYSQDHDGKFNYIDKVSTEDKLTEKIVYYTVVMSLVIQIKFAKSRPADTKTESVYEQ